jgi:asparagine synthase (glutamine-hydrolysing)
LQEALGDRGRDPSLLNRRLLADVKWGNVKIILGYADKNAMAHSVEARVPYLDRRLVEFAFSLPDTFKVGGGERKRILRDCARDLSLSPEITERADRMGFGVPEARFVRGGLWPTMKDAILDAEFRRSVCFAPRSMIGLVDRFESGREPDTHLLWRLYALAVWTRSFGVTLG